MPRINGFPSLDGDTLDLDSAGAIAATYSGLPLTAAGKVAVGVEAAPDPAQARNGLQFTTAGRLVVTLANPVATIHNGLGFDTLGRLAVTAGAALIRHNGALFDDTRRVKATVA